jgi:SAM-dependent methyltransferase
MKIKNMVRPLPGVQQISLLRQRLDFSGSAQYWERRYSQSGTSGEGSYGDFAYVKAELINVFVRDHDIRSVIEFGCGDGNQLSLAKYPHYLGLDVSPAAIRLCKHRFSADATKSFFLYNGECFVDRACLFTADLALSLDVVYHLVEDGVFETYMAHLFEASQRYVIVYATNEAKRTAPHVRHRCFTPWVDAKLPQWQLMQEIHGLNSKRDSARFFIYERLFGRSDDQRHAEPTG